MRVEGVGGGAKEGGGILCVGGGGQGKGGEGSGGRESWGRCEGEGQPTKNRLSLPKPDPVRATSHPKIHQNTTKKGKISPSVQTRERECEVQSFLLKCPPKWRKRKMGFF